MKQYGVWFVLILLISSLTHECLHQGVRLSAGQSPSTHLSSDIRPDGATRLTSPPAGSSDQNPAFSPDGTHLVFTRFMNGYNLGPAGLFLIELSTGKVVRLTPPEDQDNVNLPGSAWSGADDRIILASDRLEADDIWRIAPDGSDFSRVTHHKGISWYIEPSWSPDGKWIAFEVREPGAGEDGMIGSIWKVQADGGGLTQLTGSTSFDDRQPNWSPAGGQVLFQRRLLPDGQWDVYAVNPDGSGIHNLTNNPSSDTDASWSPDGQWIVCSSDYGGLYAPNLYAYPVTGGTPMRVTEAATFGDGAPSWSLDGKWIAFESYLWMEAGETPAALWRIPAPQVGAVSIKLYLPLVISPTLWWN